MTWEDFLTTKPLWIQSLLAHIIFHQTCEGESTTLDSFVKAQGTHGYILQVSDGSVITHDMSFGWIMATPTGKRLTGAKGPCNGRGNSLRAEGAGMLSAPMFLLLLIEYL
jgi:hypothetical protein